MKKIKLITAFCFIALINFAQNTEWSVTSSSIKFKIKNAGFTVDGTFGGLEARIIFDAAKSYSNSIESSIDAATINTDNGTRDKHLKKEEYFSVEKFPKIKLTASTFVKQADGSFKGYFKLIMKNITKDIVIPFTFVESANTAIIKGSFTLNRRDFGVGGSSIIMSDNPTVEIEVKLVKK